MSEAKINAALIEPYRASGVFTDADTAYEGLKFTPTTGRNYARIYNRIVSRIKPGYGAGDTEEVKGIFQIDVVFPIGAASASVLSKIDVLMLDFKPRTSIVFDGQRVKLSRAERSSLLDENPWQCLSLFVYYSAMVKA